MKFNRKSAAEFVSKHREYLISGFAYLVIALVMFWNITLNIATAVVNGGGDVYQSLWNLWWTPFSLFVLHQSPYITNYLFYPVGANLVTQTMTPLAGIISWPLQAVSLAFAYNVLFFTSFLLGGVFMYMLAKYITRNKYAAFIAGLIFAFSPMHIAQGYSHLQWTITEFIPLFTLFFLLALRGENRRRLYAVLAGICFCLLTFAGDIEQGMIMVVFAVVSLILLVIVERKDVLSKKSLTNMVIIAIVAFVVSLPFLVLILPNVTSGALSNANYLTDVPHNMLYSATLSNFLVPSYYNGIFHNLEIESVNQSYGLVYNNTMYSADPTEKVAYLGYVALALAVLGIVFEIKKNRASTIYWVAIGVIFVLFALGPYIQLTGTISTGIPTLYSLYKAVPLFNIVREPGRFDVIVTMALAVLAALGIKHLHDLKPHINKNMLLYTAVLAILILIEYNGMPLSSTFANQLSVGATIPKGYYTMAGVPGNFSVLTLPALPNQYTGYLYPAVGMFYATATGRPMIGGDATRMNTTQEYSLENVPLIDIANYVQTGQGLIFPYPVQENYSVLTGLWLTEYKTGFVSVDKNAYTPQEYSLLISYMESSMGNPLYQDGNVTVFATSQVTATAGHALTSYIVGTWVPGYLFCEGSSYCNLNFSAMWWGDNLRALTVLAPRAGVADVNFQALSYYRAAGVYLALNGKEVGLLNLTNETAVPQAYSVPLNLSVGFNQLEFYETNASLASQNPYYAEQPYINFGLKNITLAYVNKT